MTSTSHTPLQLLSQGSSCHVPRLIEQVHHLPQERTFRGLLIIPISNLVTPHEGAL